MKENSKNIISDIEEAKKQLQSLTQLRGTWNKRIAGESATALNEMQKMLATEKSKREEIEMDFKTRKSEFEMRVLEFRNQIQKETQMRQKAELQQQQQQQNQQKLNVKIHRILQEVSQTQSETELVVKEKSNEVHKWSETAKANERALQIAKAETIEVKDSIDKIKKQMKSINMKCERQKMDDKQMIKLLTDQYNANLAGKLKVQQTQLKEQALSAAKTEHEEAVSALRKTMTEAEEEKRKQLQELREHMQEEQTVAVTESESVVGELRSAGAASAVEYERALSAAHSLPPHALTSLLTELSHTQQH
jgi:hypothetical protein